MNKTINKTLTAMEKDKLEKAAKREAYDNSDRSYNDRRDGFIKGAEWLMGQPLVERLTEDEREKIRERYDYYMSEEPNCYLGSRMRNEYELIFSADLFREK